MTETRSLNSVVKSGDVAMLTTLTDDRHLTSRPLTVAAVGESFLDFLVDVTATWTADADDGRPVNAAVSAGGRNDWVSVDGSGVISRDRARVKELWTAPAGAYFDGDDDPNVGTLRLDVRAGEFWSSPAGGPVGRLVSLVGAALGRSDTVADHGPLD